MIKMNENMLKQIIIDTIKGEEHLGDNLKRLCVDYINQLQNNWNELKSWLESKGTSAKDENDALCYFYTYNKMQELEQGKDE